MKKSLFLIVLMILPLIVFSQHASDNDIGHFCSRHKAAGKIGFQGYKQSSLLNNYDVHFYFLDINLERTTTYISGNMSMTATVVSSQMDTIALELIDDLTVDSVFVNGFSRPFSHTSDHIFIIPSSPILQASSFTVKVYYHGDPSTGGGFFSGITNDSSPTWGNQVTWTLSEPFNANQWWPCKQILTDKADSSWVFITTSNTNKAGSNGILTNVVSVPGSKLRYEWKSNYPIVFYLISAAVAKYIDYTIYAYPAGTTDSVMIQNFVYDNPATLLYWNNEIDLTADFLELYSELMGMYPFINEKYGHCMAPLGGGMEHQTMTTLGNFNFYLVCHELAHMWFGDNVTCATWSDIWINEGFASYGEYLAANALDSYNEAQSHMLDVHNYVMSEPDGSTYIPPAETGDESRIFNGRLSYDKGSAIIHMIRFEMQDDSLFFKTLQDFQTIFADSTATGLDFKSVAETVSGVDFTDFFNQWYFGEGFPTYQVVWFDSGDSLQLTVTQTTSTITTPLFKMLMEYKVSWSGGDTLIRLYQSANLNSFTVYLPHTVTSVQVDPANWVVDGPASVIASVNEIENPAFFSLGPNPCGESLFLYFPTSNDNRELRITDLSGKTVKHQMIQENVKLDVSDLQPGMYLISVQSADGSYTTRFMRK